MRVDKLLDLAKWGFNVPRFVHNAWTNYERDTYLSLKQLFAKTEEFDIVASRKDGQTKVFRGLQLSNVPLLLIEFEGRDYETLVMEHVPKDFKGSVLFWSEESGQFYMKHTSSKFNYLGDIENLKYRHIVRTLSKLKERFPDNNVRVDFIWAKDFIGVFGSRLIVTDYFLS